MEKKKVNEYILEDAELGTFHVRANSRAKRFIFRICEGVFYITTPPLASIDEVKETIDKVRANLKKAKDEEEYRVIDLNYRIDSDCFKFRIESGKVEELQSKSDFGILQIVCPPNTDFSDNNVQTWIRQEIKASIKKTAAYVISQRLSLFSLYFKLPYKSMKISSSCGCWGSCSSKKVINISYFTVLLPSDLLDYVLLHELAHTIEMNHGKNFKAVLNYMTDGKSEELRKELKKCRFLI